MTEQMQSGVSQRIHRIESKIRPTIQLLLHAPRPELLHSRGREAFRDFVPQPKMQLDRHRNIGVEEIALPLPAGLADQRREVIGGKFLGALDRLISELPY